VDSVSCTDRGRGDAALASDSEDGLLLISSSSASLMSLITRSSRLSAASSTVTMACCLVAVDSASGLSSSKPRSSMLIDLFLRERKIDLDENSSQGDELDSIPKSCGRIVRGWA